MTSRPFGYLAFACLMFSLTFTGLAHANQDVAAAFADSAKETSQVEQKAAEQTQEAIAKSTEDIKKTLIQINKVNRAQELTPNPIGEVSDTLGSLQSATISTNNTINILMYNRLRELERVKTGTRLPFMMDTSLSQSVNVQAFDIFMRYFCDPKTRSGTQKDKAYKLTNFDVGGKPVSAMTVGCGSASGGIESRHSLLGANDDSDEAQQIIGLPLKPELFFGTNTFPSEGKGPRSATGPSNTNRAAKLYEGAFSQSMYFLLGEPPASIDITNANVTDYSAYIGGRAQVARQMLASYPFAVLFAERTGSIDPSAKERIAELLKEKMGVATENGVVLDRIEDISRRDYLSIAEYKRILMSDIMTSPGYFERINEELDVAQLKRESVWLSSLLVALNYERNRWLEMLTALEAVNGAQ